MRCSNAPKKIGFPYPPIEGHTYQVRLAEICLNRDLDSDFAVEPRGDWRHRTIRRACHVMPCGGFGPKLTFDGNFLFTFKGSKWQHHLGTILDMSG